MLQVAATRLAASMSAQTTWAPATLARATEATTLSVRELLLVNQEGRSQFCWTAILRLSALLHSRDRICTPAEVFHNALAAGTNLVGSGLTGQNPGQPASVGLDDPNIKRAADAAAYTLSIGGAYQDASAAARAAYSQPQAGAPQSAPATPVTSAAGRRLMS